MYKVCNTRHLIKHLIKVVCYSSLLCILTDKSVSRIRQIYYHFVLPLNKYTSGVSRKVFVVASSVCNMHRPILFDDEIMKS